jgi:hypothetical protein
MPAKGKGHGDASVIRRNRIQRKKLTKAQKKLLKCLNLSIKKCLQQLNDPPWHYGPRCNHP